MRYVLQRACTCCTYIPFVISLVKVSVDSWSLYYANGQNLSMNYNNLMFPLFTLPEMQGKAGYQVVTWGGKNRANDLLHSGLGFRRRQGGLFWQLTAIKISSLLPPFPQPDNFASIIFVLTAVFACLCVKPSYKLTKKTLVLWWFTWNGLPCIDMPEQAVHEWQDPAVVFERGSRERIFPFTTGELLTGSSSLMKPYLLV